MRPFFSVIIPVYNKERHILETLESVQNQTFKDFEIIVVNDGSTDDSESEILKFNPQQLHYYKTENKGASHARNFGVNKAKGIYMAFLDADDLWLPFHLEALHHLITAHPKCGLYCMAYTAFKKGIEIKSRYYGIPKTPWQGVLSDFFECSMHNCIATTPAVAMPKEIFEELGGFNTAYQSGQDIDLWIRIALKQPVAFNNKVSVHVNLDADHRLSQIKLTQKTFATFEDYKTEEQQHPSLKKYLDLNRFVLAIKYKLEGDANHFKQYKNRIDKTNLSLGKRLALSAPKWLLKGILNFKITLTDFGFPIKLFK